MASVACAGRPGSDPHAWLGLGKHRGLATRTHTHRGRLQPRHLQTRSRECGARPRGEEPAGGCLPPRRPGRGHVELRAPRGRLACARAARSCCGTEASGQERRPCFELSHVQTLRQRLTPAQHVPRDGWRVASLPVVGVTPRVVARERCLLSPTGGQSHDAHEPCPAPHLPTHLHTPLTPWGQPRPGAASEDRVSGSVSRM